MPIPIQRWRDILIDFIVDLLSSNRFMNIIVVVNCLIKMQYIILIESINAILVAKCFVNVGMTLTTCRIHISHFYKVVNYYYNIYKSITTK